MANLRDALGEDFIPENYIGKQSFNSYDPPRIGARKAMEEYGMKPPATFGVGEMFRFPDATDLSKGRRNGKGGWAIYYEFYNEDHYVGVCVFGSHHGDFETVKWCNKNQDYMTTHERAQFNDRLKSAQQKVEKEREESQELARKECQQIWDKATKVNETPYTKAKGITPYGARTNGSALIVPIEDKNGIASLQYIAEDGNKKMHAGGKKKGCWFKIEGTNDVVYICEGYSTGCTIHEMTGATVYVAFDSGNLFDVTAHVSKAETGRIVIAADNDYANKINTGLEMAKKAAEAHHVNIIVPDFEQAKCNGSDFNDLLKHKGADYVKAKLALPEPAMVAKEVQRIEEITHKDKLTPPKGVLTDIMAFYNATSGNRQEGFAIQTAIAIVSVMCGRYFISDQDNMASIYLLNVGKSATGKEHCKKIFERVLMDCQMENRIGGDGFTSGAAVHSMLQSRPVCGVVIDEFGRYLEAASESKGGMQKEANTTLMEAISRPDGVLRPKNYSTMTLSNDHAREMQQKLVYNPAITLLGLTTPSTFFDQIKMSSVLDGFLNRFLIYVSDAKRQPRKRVSMFDTPNAVLDWAKSIRNIIEKNNSIETAQEKSNKKRIHFKPDAVEIQQAFELEMIALQDELEISKLEAIAGRSNEWAMRLALISALSRDPDTDFIEAVDMTWAVEYSRHSTMTLLREVRDNVSESFIEASKKEILIAIRDRKNGISWKDMQMQNPFMKHKAQDLKATLQSLMDAELIETRQASGGRGRPTTLYFSVGS